MSIDCRTRSINKRNGEWENIEPLDNDWMVKILPIIESLHGSYTSFFYSTKEFSIVWN